MFYSKTWNTQLIYDFKKSWKYDGIWLEGKYPKSVVPKWPVAKKKAYWSSERVKARRVMRMHETPDPSKHRHSANWFD